MTESAFQAPAFLKNTNIYEINIRQYTAEGTFNSFAQHLPRLKETGIEILWLMPVHPIGAVKRKETLGSYYSIRDHKAVNTEFGTEQDLKDMIMKAHSLGMKIILDWVANHTAWDHVWTKTNPDFFVHDEAGNFKPPYDWDDVIQIDHTNVNEQAAMIDAMQYWITEFDIDGFRADLAHLTPLHFWKDARLKLSPFKKDTIWLAETEEVDYHEAFDISFTWEWMHATEKYTRKEISLKDCLQVLNKYKIDFPINAKRLFFTSNHDENSWNGTEYEKYGIFGKALAVFSFTYPGSVPLIYSGQELPNMKRLNFFDKDVIEWQSGIQLQEFYKTLSELRSQSRSFNEAEIFFFSELIEKNVVAYKLSDGEKVVLVFLNLNEAPIEQHIFSAELKGSFRDIFSGEISELQNEFLFSAAGGGFKILENVLS